MRMTIKKCNDYYPYLFLSASSKLRRFSMS